MFTLSILSTLVLGICLGRIWDALRAQWEAEDLQHEQTVQTRIATRVAAIGQKSEPQHVEVKVA
jgi:hypothetical protein